MPYPSVYATLSGRRTEHQVLPQTMSETLHIVGCGTRQLHFEYHKY